MIRTSRVPRKRVSLERGIGFDGGVVYRLGVRIGGTTYFAAMRISPYNDPESARDPGEARKFRRWIVERLRHEIVRHIADTYLPLEKILDAEEVQRPYP